MRIGGAAVLFLVSAPFGVASPIISGFDMASRFQISKFALPIKFPSCGELVGKLAPEIGDHVQMVTRGRAENLMMNDRNVMVRPFVNLRGGASDYYRPMWDVLNGRTPPMSQIPQDVRNYAQLTNYIGTDALGDPVAVLRGGRVITKDKGVRPTEPGVMMIYPEWQAHNYWVLDDIYLAPEFVRRGFVNEHVMFRGLVQTVILSNPNQMDVDRIIAVSNHPRRSAAVEAMGFEKSSMPSRGMLHMQSGSELREIRFHQEKNAGTQFYVYFVDRAQTNQPFPFTAPE